MKDEKLMNRKRGKLEPMQLKVPSEDAVPSSVAGSLDGCMVCWWHRDLHFMDLLHFLKTQAKKKNRISMHRLAVCCCSASIFT